MGKARGDEVRWTIEPDKLQTLQGLLPCIVHFRLCAARSKQGVGQLRPRATVSTHHHVFLNAEIEKEAVVLEGAGNAQLGDPVGRQPGDRLAVEIDVAFVGHVNTANQIKQSALARTVGTN